MNSTIISLDKVSLSLPGPGKHPVSILHNIDLEVQQGEMVSIVGPSGSGKTSLMMLIAGVEQASSGKLVVANKDITTMNEDELAAFRQAHIGIVFQNFHLIPTMTALENVAIGLDISGHDNAEATAMHWLKEVGLGERVQHYPSELSGGEQQRVALARAFAAEPDILLADEPTGNLDGKNSEMVADLLFDLQKRHGTTFILITHDKELAAQTDRSCLMQDGRLSDRV